MRPYPSLKKKKKNGALWALGLSWALGVIGGLASEGSVKVPLVKKGEFPIFL